jgi:hypothetical protein
MPVPATVTIVPAGWPAAVEQVATPAAVADPPTDMGFGPYQGGTFAHSVPEASGSEGEARLTPGTATPDGGATLDVVLPQPRLTTAIETAATTSRLGCVVFMTRPSWRPMRPTCNWAFDY